MTNDLSEKVINKQHILYIFKFMFLITETEKNNEELFV